MVSTPSEYCTSTFFSSMPGGATGAPQFGAEIIEQAVDLGAGFRKNTIRASGSQARSLLSRF